MKKKSFCHQGKSARQRNDTSQTADGRQGQARCQTWKDHQRPREGEGQGMTDPRHELLAEFDQVRERIHQAWHEMLGPPGSPRFSPPVIAPPVDVYETKDSVVVVMELAGINEQEVRITIAGDKLTIRGEREDRQATPGRLYTQMEICCGPFERTITLPAEIDADKTTGTYHDGFLEIVLPRAQRPLNRQVRITFGEGRDQS